MTKFVLVRHGEPTYDEIIKLGFKGTGLSLAPLTPKGIQSVKETAEDYVVIKPNHRSCSRKSY